MKLNKKLKNICYKNHHSQSNLMEMKFQQKNHLLKKRKNILNNKRIKIKILKS